MNISEKFALLGINEAAIPEALAKGEKIEMRGEALHGPKVDFTHGDVNAFKPAPGCFETFSQGFFEGQSQAYTPTRGRPVILEHLAKAIASFTGARVNPDKNLLISSGAQCALFLAAGACIMPGDKVAVVEPDYFANRRLVDFFGGEPITIPMKFDEVRGKSGIDLFALEKAFVAGAKLFIFSNPNNPTGCVYSASEIEQISAISQRHDALVIVDELYSRMVYNKVNYTHLCNKRKRSKNLITVLGPSQTESLSGFRLGVALGPEELITRMERLQALTTLSAPGYCQAVLDRWFVEPTGWIQKRVTDHQIIRDVLVQKFQEVPGVTLRPSDGGPFLFVKLPPLDVDIVTFAYILRKHANVAVTPGRLFGERFKDYIRINYSQNIRKTIPAIERLIEMLERYRKAEEEE